MKTKLRSARLLLLTSALLGSALLATAQSNGSAFTYQGQLTDTGSAAQGSYDLRFRLYDDAAAGSQVGGDVTVTPVAVSNGLFTVTLDFGAAAFNGAARWLDIAVRTNGSVAAHTALNPRQPFTAAPYALYAFNAANAVAAASLPWSGLTGLPAAFADGVDNDTLYAAGAGLTLSGTNFSLNTAFTDGRYWKLTGNAGTMSGVNFLGTTDNQALELRVNNARALRIEPNATSPNVIGGYAGNSVGAGVAGATIGGGGRAGFFGGPDLPNVISDDFATVGGGVGNAATASSSTIAGGAQNRIETEARFAGIGGGSQNLVRSSAEYAVIGGGESNTVQTTAPYATIGGGSANTIQANATFGTIAGGQTNTIATSARGSTIGGGEHNTIEPNAQLSTIGGGTDNHVKSIAMYATISGGNNNRIGTNAGYATIGGGDSNEVGTNAGYATISGGTLNAILTNADWAAIGGGRLNRIQTDARGATVSGGGENTIQPGATNGTISGGYRNTIRTNGRSSTVAGGLGNTIGTNADYNAISGGLNNTNNGDVAVISGGELNRIEFGALGSTIGGGETNVIKAYANWATIPGGFQCVASADYAFAAGRRAVADHPGCFVWADSNDFDFGPANANQFYVRAIGGVRITTAIDGTGATTAGVRLLPGDSTWDALCDRNAKTNFAAVNARDVLARVVAMPVQTWNYKSQEAEIRHMGPMAQDFRAAFSLGADDTHISTVDADGVALAAIQGLHQMLKERDEKLANLASRLAALERVIASRADTKSLADNP